MKDIPAMTVTQSAEELKGEPFLLNVLQKRPCAVVIIRMRPQPMACRRTSYDHKESYTSTVARDNHSSLFQISFDNQEHSVRQQGDHVPLMSIVSESIRDTGLDSNLLTPDSFDVFAQLKVGKWPHSGLHHNQPIPMPRSDAFHKSCRT